MIRIGRVFVPLLELSISICFAMLLPSAAQAVCPQWDVSGEWDFPQTNDTSPHFTLQQTGTELHGTARYSWVHKSECKLAFCGDDYYHVEGSVDGTINGDSFEVTAYWNNGTTGLYTGKVGPLGRLEGNTYDKEHPQTMARWHSNQNAKCLTSAGGTSAGGGAVTPPINDGGTVKAQGRVKTGGQPSSTSTLTICEKAKQARARNSPAAPGLEASCAAATNAASDTAVEEQADTAGKGKAPPPKDEACAWRGEAPWCEGRCGPGEIKIAAENDSEAAFARAHPDFGTSCASGFKLYCCRQ
jgi:hypothetical protein